MRKNPSSTKSGPGRYHSAGQQKLGRPRHIPARGAQARNPEANQRRHIKAQIGARQLRKAIKAARRNARANH